MGQILAVTCLYLNRRCKLLNIEELRFFEFGVINHENLWEIGKTCAHVSKKCKKQFVFNMVEIYLWFNLWQPVGDIPLSLSKWCIVEHCKTSEAKQLFSCLGIFQTTPKRNTIFHFVFLLGFNFDTPQWTEAIAAQLLLLELTIENIEKYRCWW